MNKASESDHILNVLAEIKDDKLAEKRMTAHSSKEWDTEFRAALETTRSQLEHVEARLVSSNDNLRTLENRLSKTDELIPARQPKKSAEGKGGTSWSLYEVVMFWLAMSGGVLAAALGAGNLYANMMASMSPVFLETPELALGLSMLLPLGSLALKFASSRFSTNKGQRIYELTIFISTVIALVIWAFLVAQAFPGVAAPIDIESMLGGSADGAQGGSALVLMQLLVELLTGSSLWIAGFRTYRLKNPPDTLIENPEYIALRTSVDQQRAEVKAICEEHGTLQGAVTKLEAQRDLYISNRCIKLTALRNHLQATRAQFN